MIVAIFVRIICSWKDSPHRRDNQVHARIAVGTDPILLTASEHDALWVGNLDDPSLWRIDIQDNSARRMIETVETDPEDPNGRYRFTAGPGFVAASDGSGIVRLFDAASAAPIGQVDAGEPVRSLAAAGGALWASQPEQSLLVRIDPTNLRITERLAVPAGCKEIVGSQDSVWLASALHKVVARVDAITGALAETVDLAIRPVLMAVDGNSVWITQTIPGRVVKLR